MTDVLTNLLILELRRLDAIAKANKGTAIDNSSLFNKYVQYLNEKCKISFHPYTDQDSNNLKWRDLTGPEKYHLFNKIDITQLFPSLPNSNKIQQIWTNFMKINDFLKSDNIDEVKIAQFSKDVTNWVDFLSVYQAKRVTP